MWTRQWRLASMQGLRQQSNLAASVGSRELALSIIIAERFVTHLAVQSQHTCNNTTALILYSYKQCKISEHIYIKLWSSTCIIHMYMYVILQYNLETEKCSGLTLEIYGIVVCDLRAACCCWNTPSTRHTRAQTDLETITTITTRKFKTSSKNWRNINEVQNDHNAITCYTLSVFFSSYAHLSLSRSCDVMWAKSWRLVRSSLEQ